ncbi:MAG: hypothetical protein FWE08_02290 [Oscillospiraceae bacterium]|nr:hypothetical protein [Oscillospiraceae bacterium]
MNTNKTSRYKKITLFMASLALFALTGLILSACSATNPEENDPITEQEYTPTPEPEEINISIIGLPVTLRDVTVEELGRPTGDHTAAYQLSQFFTYPIGYPGSSVDLFAFVRVLDVEQSATEWDLLQHSTLQILSTVWSRDVEIPETVTIIQGVHSHGSTEDPIFVREGGVYLLPLINNSAFDGLWRVRSPFRVLFEVDDNGLIWSHSSLESFSRFDGEGASVVVDEILEITSDENFDAATTSFGYWAGRDWASLVEFTVLSVTRVEGVPDSWSGGRHYRLVLYIDDVLVPGNDAPPSRGNEVITILHYTASGQLEEGQRYLSLTHSFVPNNYGPHSLDSRIIARINEDGTITAIPSGFYFRDFDGFTVEQMRELTERSRAWYEAHVKDLF